MTPRLIYTDFVAQIKSSSGLFFCYWLTCGIVMACLWPRSGKQEWATQVPQILQYILKTKSRLHKRT